MSRNYDNWERLVAAVLRRQQLWEICHQHSRTPSSVSSVSSSDFSFNSSFLDFANYTEDGLLPSKYSQSLPFQIAARFSIDLSLEKKEPSRLVFLEVSPYIFGLEELLMASSDVLGQDMLTFSRTFLVSLRNNITVVVKKYDMIKYTLEEMETRLKIIGSIEHENVAKLRAYYLSKDHMLLVYDYFSLGSVHTMLHGKGGETLVNLDWESRSRIAIGAAKGLAHIHNQNGRRFSYGHIKASNIFLNRQQGHWCLGDLGPLYTPNSGYHGPEVSSQGKVFQESDVYSFGAFLIELVSGRSPTYATRKFENYVEWARHNARDEWTALVFNKWLLRDHRVKLEMLTMLEIALSCTKKKPEERPVMNEVVEMLENMQMEHIQKIS